MSGTNEGLRKLVHISIVGFAFLLGTITWWQAAVVALAGAFYNAVVFRRLHGDALFREQERKSGFSAGMVYYPLAVFCLVVVFRDQLVVAGAAWAILALGDGVATLAGRGIGSPALSWNRDKTVAGSAGFVVAGSAGAIILSWSLRDLTVAPVAFERLVVASVLATVLAAVAESLVTGLDDNIVVPGTAGVVYWLAIRADLTVLASTDFLGGLVIGVLVAGMTGGLAFLAKSIDGKGLVAGTAVGAAVWVGAGPGGYVTLVTFFVLGVGTTKIGFRHKEERGLAEARGGRRSVRHALANGLVGASAALAAPLVPDLQSALVLAFVAAFATAGSDTVASEIGKRYGARAFLPTTFRRVAPGTEGAISIEGTTAGVLAALIISGSAGLTGVLSPLGVVAATLGAVAGNHLESLAGHIIGAEDEIENEALNFLNTLAGAVIAVLVMALLGRIA